MTSDANISGWPARAVLIGDAMLLTLLGVLLAKLALLLGGSLIANILYWGVVIMAPSLAVLAVWMLSHRDTSRRFIPALAASSLAGWLISAGVMSLAFLINTSVAGLWWLAFVFLAALTLGMAAAAAADLIKEQTHLRLDAVRIAGLAAAGFFLAQTPRYDSAVANAGLELLLMGALVLIGGVVMLIHDRVSAY